MLMGAVNQPSQPRLRVILLSALGLLLVLLVVAGLRSYRDLEALEGREQVLDARIEATRARIEGHREWIDRIESSPAALETLAREQLGMVRPDDVVFMLPTDPPSRPAPDLQGSPEQSGPAPADGSVGTS